MFKPCYAPAFPTIVYRSRRMIVFPDTELNPGSLFDWVQYAGIRYGQPKIDGVVFAVRQCEPNQAQKNFPSILHETDAEPSGSQEQAIFRMGKTGCNSGLRVCA